MVQSIMASRPCPELAKQKTILPWQKNGLKPPHNFGGGEDTFVLPGFICEAWQCKQQNSSE